RAASSREVPSRIIAIASSRRALAASSLFAAEARSSLGVWSMRVMTTAALTRSSNAANRRFKGSESYFRGFENRGGGESSSVAVGIKRFKVTELSAPPGLTPSAYQEIRPSHLLARHAPRPRVSSSASSRKNARGEVRAG